MYIVKIGVPFSEQFNIDGYTHTKADAVSYLKALGYTHYNRHCDYYETDPRKHIDGEWARIEHIFLIGAK